MDDNGNVINAIEFESIKHFYIVGKFRKNVVDSYKVLVEILASFIYC